MQSSPDGHRAPTPRAPLPPHSAANEPNTIGMTHDELVAALRSCDALDDVGVAPPSFHFRSKPFLHFHTREGETYADVRFGIGDFEPVWASTPLERLELLGRVLDHVERLDRSRKGNRTRRGRR